MGSTHHKNMAGRGLAFSHKIKKENCLSSLQVYSSFILPPPTNFGECNNFLIMPKNIKIDYLLHFATNKNSLCRIDKTTPEHLTQIHLHYVFVGKLLHVHWYMIY